jgi:EmrB/QacA subfamily drug resistance transporter
MPKDFSSPRAKTLALVVLALSQFVIVIDASIVNVALPSVGAALHISQDNLSWVVNAYILTFGGFLLLGGRLADLLGRRRMFIIGIVTFTVASLLGGLAQNEAWLNAARALQGLGAALTSPAALSILTTTFKEGAERNRALAVWGAMSGAGGAAGVLLGGVLTQYFGWEWVLFVNVPIGALLAWQAPLRFQPAAGSGRGNGFDLPGSITVTAGLALLVFTLVDGEDAGWTSLVTLLRALGAILLLVAFVLIERRSKAPLVDLSIFRLRTLRGANVAMLLVGASLISMFFLITLYTQQVLDYTPLQAGLTYLPLAFSIAVAATLASGLINRFGFKVVLLAALACVAVGLAWLSFVRTDGTFLVDLLGPSILAGVGLGGSLVAVTVAALAGTTEQQAGLASGLINAGNQIGGAIGLAVISSVAAITTARALSSGAETTIALTDGFHAAFLVGASIAAAALVFAAVMISSRDSRDHARAAQHGDAATPLV